MNTELEVLRHSNLPSVEQRLPRLLLVAYNFPPVGGAGVQRPVKWVKYLRKLGWDVSVLTTENPSVPALDHSLLADIPDDVLVMRARTWEPDYQTKKGLNQGAQAAKAGLVARAKSAFKSVVKQGVKLALQPDPQVLWVPNAVKAGRRLLRDLNHDAILVTAPAYSSFYIGTALKRQFGLPLIFDFRDEWDMSGKYLENAQRDHFSCFVQNWMQRSLLKKADAVVATTMASTANLAQKLANVGRSTTSTRTIYNGYDSEEFGSGRHRDQVGDQSPRTPKKFRLLYTGTLWNLTTIEPLVDALLKLHGTEPSLLDRMELVCVGRKTAEQTAILDRVRATACDLKLIDYCPHAEALDYLQSADAVCLLLSDVPGAERVVPAKLFEYLANGKQMLSIVPKGETADIVDRFYATGNFEPANVDGIANWLKAQLLDHNESKLTAVPQGIEEYSRETQTRRLVDLLNELTSARVAAGGGR